MSESHATPAASVPAAEHDHSHDAEHVAKHVKGYFVVGGILIFCTAVTVWLSYIDFDHMFGHGGNFIIAMILASFKVCLVGAIFMHLKGEKWTIWRFLLFTVFFAAGLFLLTLLNWSDPIFGTNHTHH
jgi:heme/copper-type cytochrome/quinol oxidase subunit 4